jgi:transposase
MVFEHQDEYPSQWKAIESMSAKLSINHETLRQWVRRAETDAGQRPGLTTDERAQLRALQREVKELRRANEMADSTGQRNESCEIGDSRSQEEVDAGSTRALECGTEAAGVPVEGTRLASRQDR